MHKLLHLTGLKVTKYGSMEKYLIQMSKMLVRYQHVFQLENSPSSVKFIEDMNRNSIKANIIDTVNFNIYSFFTLIKLLLACKPKVIFFHFVSRKVILVIIIINKIFLKAKLIAFVHNVHHLNKKSKAKYIYNMLDHILAVSDAVKTDLLNGGVNKEILSTHYLGLVKDNTGHDEKKTTRDKFNLSDQDIILGNIAFDSEFKGIDILIKSLPIVLRQHPNVKLLQFGVDIQKSKLKLLSENLGLQDKIVWAGIIDNAASQLTACDIYIQPSRFGEGLPLSIMEAMATKLPVIATDVAGNAEAVVDKKTGFLCHPNDEENLAATIIKMIEDKSNWQYYGDKGHIRYLELFDANGSIENLEKNYLKLK